MEYLDYKFEDNEQFISTFDEAPLWSAAFGLLLLRHVDLKANSVVVDIGSGAGFPLFELAGRLGSSSKIYGIDPWKNAMTRAKMKKQNYGYHNVELIESSAQNIPLPNESVDLIVSNLGINNFEEPELVFKECYRILRPKGNLALTTNLNGHWKLFYQIFGQTLEQLNRTNFLNKLEEQQKHRGSPESVSKLFTGAGLRIIKIKEEELPMKFTNGTAFLNHHFVKPGWLSSWLDIIPPEERREFFFALETNLNTYAEHNGGLMLNVPMLFIEGEK